MSDTEAMIEALDLLGKTNELIKHAEMLERRIKIDIDTVKGDREEIDINKARIRVLLLGLGLMNEDKNDA